MNARKAGLYLFLVGIGAVVAAGLMFYLDPVSGRRRRARLADKSVHYRKISVRWISGQAKNIVNHLRGVSYHVTWYFKRERPTDDDLLSQRVKSHIGRFLSHARSVHVEAHDGAVVLTGSVLASEAMRIIGAARHVHGVKRVINRLSLQATAAHTSGLHEAH